MRPVDRYCIGKVLDNNLLSSKYPQYSISFQPVRTAPISICINSARNNDNATNTGLKNSGFGPILVSVHSIFLTVTTWRSCGFQSSATEICAQGMLLISLKGFASYAIPRHPKPFPARNRPCLLQETTTESLPRNSSLGSKRELPY